MNQKRIAFLTGTRADFGKIKGLVRGLNENRHFAVHIFATGMHLNKIYGKTIREIKKCGFKNIYAYKNGVEHGFGMSEVLARTIKGFDYYVKKIKPDLIVVHGDRIEALAGAIVGSLNNLKVAHIEGGEVSGTVDEHIRHSITKLANFHFVANAKAKKRLIQMGENKCHIFVIGSPDIDLMLSNKLPSLNRVRRRYAIPFEKYSILLYHPVVTEHRKISRQTRLLVETLIASGKNYAVIYPNNDLGSDIIRKIYREKIVRHPNFKLHPSIRFEYFLTLVKNCDFLIGNSSAGIRETPFYGIPSINIGSRQSGRTDGKKIPSINQSTYNKKQLLSLIKKFSARTIRYKPVRYFGDGNSSEKFIKILSKNSFWNIKTQKQFIDIDY